MHAPKFKKLVCYLLLFESIYIFKVFIKLLDFFKWNSKTIINVYHCNIHNKAFDVCERFVILDIESNNAKLNWIIRTKKMGISFPGDSHINVEEYLENILAWLKLHRKTKNNVPMQ